MTCVVYLLSVMDKFLRHVSFDLSPHSGQPCFFATVVAKLSTVGTWQKFDRVNSVQMFIDRVAPIATDVVLWTVVFVVLT